MLSALVETLQPSRIYTPWNSDKSRFSSSLVKESWLSRTPLSRNKALSLPFMPNLWRNLSDNEADYILVSSHAFAHHANSKNRDIPKIGYIHTPARYLWFPEVDRRGSSFVFQNATAVLRSLDAKRAKEMHSIVANSSHVSEKIQKVWEVESSVIYPPVDVEYFHQIQDLSIEDELILEGLPKGYILAASRFVPYKRLEIAIKLGEISGRPVVLAGDGPDLKRLQALAAESSASTFFVKRPSKSLLANLYKFAHVFSFFALEDFGIMPVEAMASGTPVIGLDKGGVSETVISGQTGYLIEHIENEQLIEALAIAENIDPLQCQQRSKRFSKEEFTSAIQIWVESVI